ncbi:hypothetical protein M6D93_03660 [Jatrophihabitans telluris]|uniref:Lipoprotein n=1 Tax=Jatrophihabitans telluris TaxID=2038343 RepID=A0ABY4QZW1_9ACTN|nr:hypothetical protein [Jatrophihabitans telluris]UQX89105.1 hypothetical protein M6D93_03660 [Jatrophihabitans telluris]
MRRALSYTAAGVAMIASLAACDSGKKGSSSSSTPPSGAGTSGSSGVSGKGAGTAILKVGSTSTNFAVTCTQTQLATQATGNEGADAVTLTVKGTPISAVLVTHGKDGTTTIFQAIANLRDDNGKALGKINVSVAGDKYSGTGTFVLTKIDSKGKRVKLTDHTSQTGSFTLTCASGYAPVPTASSRPSSSSAKPSSTATKSKAKPAGTKSS